MPQKWHDHDVPRRYPKPVYRSVPWYKNELFIILVGVIVAVVASLTIGDPLFR